MAKQFLKIGGEYLERLATSKATGRPVSEPEVNKDGASANMGQLSKKRLSPLKDSGDQRLGYMDPAGTKYAFGTNPNEDRSFPDRPAAFVSSSDDGPQ